MRAGKTEIRILTGDLTDQETDAIVNAANNSLLLGAGVAGAIRRRGGDTIQRECDEHGPIRVGEAVITGAGQLPSGHVIHAASMGLGGSTTDDSLSSSIDHSFRLAREHGLRSVSLPAVGTGIAGFPLARCAKVMAASLYRALQAGWEPDEVRFVLFDDAAEKVFEPAFRAEFGRLST
jgi:O-acetyl-ADP-ribose deacetylase (regulator of RNase III)